MKMMSFYFFALGVVVLLSVVAVVWRLWSRRASLPCPAWLGWMVEMDNPLLRNNSARWIIGHLALAPGMRVLDLGCGPGRLTIPAAEAVGPAGSVTAFDVQDGMLARVRDKARAAGLDNIQYLQGAAGAGRLGRDQYDRVLLVTVLGEIPDQVAAMREIADCLRPGGILSVTEVIADPHFQRRTSVRQTAAQAGLVERACFGNAISFTIHFVKTGTQ